MELTSVRKNSLHASSKIKTLSIRERLHFIKELKKVILDHSERIIEQIQHDTGKSKSDALVSEIFAVLDHLVYLEKNAKKALKDESVATPLALMGKKSKIFYEPMGTVLIISPWNYPFYQAVVPITAAFVAGNAVVYKPSEHTPLTGLIEEMLEKSGFEENWIQVVYGDGKMGADLIGLSPDKVFFTGSDRTGKLIMKQCADLLIPVELELGGKDPMIVFEDVHIKRAVAGALWGSLTNLGQSCTSVERCYVHRSIYSAFKEEMLSQLKHIKQEKDKDGDADVGLMTTDFQVEIVNELLNDAREKGAEISMYDAWDGKSRKIPPIIIDNIDPKSDLMSIEIFGPIIPLIPFENEKEVIQMANDSVYGLSASVWSRDLKRAERVARAIKTGNVSINNVMLTEGNSALPFGGVKNSGMGRYKGKIGLHSFCNIKSILIDKDSANIESNWYPYTMKKYQIFAEMTRHLYSDGIMSFIKFAIKGMGLESYSNKIAKKGRNNE